MSTPIKAIIFDYGGTLDSRGDHWSEVIWRAYQHAGADVTRERFRSAYVHAERALDGSGIILHTDNFLAVMRKKTALQLEWLGLNDTTMCENIALKCYHDARECVGESAITLRSLAARYPLAIVSNFYGNVRTVLQDFGLLPYISAVIDSTEAGIRKPDPAIFRLGIDALAATIQSSGGGTLSPEEVLVVGDSLGKDILPAHSLGCRTALLPGIPWDTNATQPAPPTTTKVLTAIADLEKIL